MLQFFKDRWQGRFQYGFSIGGGGLNINRYSNGSWVFGLAGPALESAGTGHWPWIMFEAVCLTGPAASWHVGLLGITVGMCKEHSIDEEGEVDGPDYNRYFVFLKCLNHMNQSFEEIINNAN